jgi:hypothetical protein
MPHVTPLLWPISPILVPGLLFAVIAGKIRLIGTTSGVLGMERRGIEYGCGFARVIRQGFAAN